MGEVKPRSAGFIVTVHSADHEPAHVHVFPSQGRAEILFYIGPIVTLREIRGRISSKVVRAAHAVVTKKLTACNREWERCHGKARTKTN